MELVVSNMCAVLLVWNLVRIFYKYILNYYKGLKIKV